MPRQKLALYTDVTDALAQARAEIEDLRAEMYAYVGGAKMLSGAGYAALAGATGTAATVANSLYLQEWRVQTAGTISAVTVNVTAAGAASSVIRLGLYSIAGDLLAEWGTVAADAIASPSITGLSTAVNPGRYYIAFVPEGGAPTVRTNTGSGYGPQSIGSVSTISMGQKQQASITPGSLPSVLGTLITSGTVTPRVVITAG